MYLYAFPHLPSMYGIKRRAVDFKNKISNNTANPAASLDAYASKIHVGSSHFAYACRYTSNSPPPINMRIDTRRIDGVQE